MICKEFVANLLEALEEDEVIEKIREITTENEYKEVRVDLEEKNSKIKELEDEIVDLKNSLFEKDETIKQLETRNNKLRDEKSNLQREIQMKNDKLVEFKEIISNKDNQTKTLEAKNKKLAAKVSRLQNRFKELEDVYKTYQSLSNEVKVSLKGIFKGNGIKEFIYCGVQHDSLESLWEYIKRKVIEGQDQELAKLEEIFSYFLAAHNQIYDSPLYQRQEVSVGDKVDQDKHILGKDSKVIGDISEIIFRGYVNLKTGKVSKKSVVRV